MSHLKTKQNKTKQISYRLINVYEQLLEPTDKIRQQQRRAPHAV